ncbi:hypothetical protein [Microbacterium sp. NPDC091662]|uniref:DUF7507 domain-containing protein n=1 Tax=Microbacterium sp. NPDC091662 TaxID=3364211 RepID=UPI00382ADD8C
MLATFAVVVAGVFVPGVAAHAAGNAVLDVGIEPVNNLTGAPISGTGYGQNNDRIAYKVSFSCAVEACTNASVKLSPSQVDPYGIGSGYLLQYETWTRPDGSTTTASPSGSDKDGWTFPLGDIAAGDSGTFLAVYQVLPSRKVAGASRPVPAQWYPSGFQIKMAATLKADTASNAPTATASPVTWSSTVPDPRVSITPGQTATPGGTANAYLKMTSGAFRDVDYSLFSNADVVGAGSFKNVLSVPLGLTPNVPVVNGGVWDPATRTITWSRGTKDAPDAQALGGWGSVARAFNATAPYGQRDVSFQVDPGASFPGADASGCNFSTDLDLKFATEVTYLDTARTTKTANTTAKLRVACWAPFGTAGMYKEATLGGGAAATDIPIPNTVATTGTWAVVVQNKGNRPAVAVIEDDLTKTDLPVTRVWASLPGGLPGGAVNGSVIEWRLDDGTTGSTPDSVTAPPGRTFTWVRLTSPEIKPGRQAPSETTSTQFSANFVFSVLPGMTPGARTNTATSTMTWPGTDIKAAANTASKTVRLVGEKAEIRADFTTPAVVDGGGQAVPERAVTFTVGGSTAKIPGTGFNPEYVFIAPTGWTVQKNSATFDTAVPAGVQISYASKQINGVMRDVVVARWPQGTSASMNASAPKMHVIASPTFAVAAGTQSVAETWFGDSERRYTTDNTTFAFPKEALTAVQNTADVDGSGQTSAWFSAARQTVTVSGADNLGVLKEICLPTAGAPEGCTWLSDSAKSVPVPSNATDIKYRITLQNHGNTTLSNVVGYDVLPFIGDTGLIPGTVGTSRGSQFSERVGTVSAVSANLTLSYSASTNPARPEVSPAGTVNDWGPSASGKQAIRAVVSGSLAPGQKAQFTYTASVLGGKPDLRACNSVAIDSAQTLPSEPTAVCALIAEADLSAGGVDTISTQQGRPTTFPFVFANESGTSPVATTVKISIPAGVTIPNLNIQGWTCTPTDAPITGPATLTCTPLKDMPQGVKVPFDLPAIVTSPTPVSVTAEILTNVRDTNPDNNSHTITTRQPDAPAVSLGVEKTDGVTGVVRGQQTTYTVSIRNPLVYEQLNGVQVVDTLPTGTTFVSASDGGTFANGAVAWTIPSIAANAVQTRTVTVHVDDTAAATIRNEVTATVTDPAFGPTVLTGTATDDNTVDAISLTKSATLLAPGDPARPSVGDTVQYRFEVTNTGGGPLSEVTVNDPMKGLSKVSFPDGWPTLPGHLGAGESVTGVATYALTQADIDAGTVTNEASVSGSSAGGEAATAKSGVDFPLSAASALTVAKAGSLTKTGTTKAGDTVDYSFTVTNTGNTTVRSIVLSDPKLGPDPVLIRDAAWPSTPGQLAPGASVKATGTYTLTQADIDAGSVPNTATASGLDATGTEVRSEGSDTVAIVAEPGLTLKKTGALPNGVDAPTPGAVVDFTFVVKNTGNVTIDGVAIIDHLAGVSAPALSGSWPNTVDRQLAPGQEATFTAAYTLTASDVDAGRIVNTATATAIPVRGVLDPADAETTVTWNTNPALTLQKTSSLDTTTVVVAGDEVEYTFRAENTGNVTLDDIRLTDQMLGLDAVPFPGTITGQALGAGDTVVGTVRYTVTQADIDRGTILNKATATGTAPDGREADDDGDTETIIPAAPAASFVKTGVLTTRIDGSGDEGTLTAPVPGQIVRFEFAVRNAGNVTISGIDVTDPLKGLGAVTLKDGWPGVPGSLAPGQQAVFIADYPLTAADLDKGSVANTATLTGDPVRGDELDLDSSTTVTLPQTPSLKLTKTSALPDAQSPKAGDIVKYRFTIENTGNVTAHDITIDDPMQGLSEVVFGDWPGEEGVLPAGGKVTATATYALTQADIDEATGTIVNTATVHGTDGDGDPITSESSATTDLPAVPGVEFRKLGEQTTGDNTRPVPGDELGFTFEVKNTGNVTVNTIEITDQLEGVSAISEGGDWPTTKGVLLPGEKMTFTATYAVDQSSIDAGGVTNIATVDVTPSRGTKPPKPTAEVRVPLAQAPRLELVKTAEVIDANKDGKANPGERVTYSFAVTNSGNTTLNDVTVQDPRLSQNPVVGTLAPGEKRTVTADYIVTDSDAASEEMINTANVTGITGTDLSTTSPDSTAVVPTGPIPSTPSGGLAITGGAAQAGLIVGGASILVAGAFLFLLAARNRRRREAVETEAPSEV